MNALNIFKQTNFRMEVIFERIIEHMKGTATTTTGAYILYKGTALTTSATDYTLGG